MNHLKDLTVGIGVGGFLKSFDHATTFRTLKKIGYGAADYPLCYDWNKENPLFEGEAYLVEFQRIRALAEEAEIRIHQTHAFFPMETREDEWLIKTYERQIHATRILGADYIVIHPRIPDYRASARELTMEENVKFFRRLIPALERHKVTACLENLWEFERGTEHIVRTNTSTAEDFIELLSRLNSERFAVCFDTGHMQNIGADVSGEIRKLGGLIKVLHVHDNDVFTDSHDLPMFGKMDWRSVMNALNEIGFQGVFNLELNIGGRVGRYDRELVAPMAELAYRISRSLLEKAVT